MKKPATKKVITEATPKAEKPAKAPATPKAAKALSIAAACETALEKLRELNLDASLQADLQWCLGSFQHDGNPAGLYLMAKRAVAVFTVEKANKTKGITAKLITDLEKAIGSN
jgi:hypothetical protein